jgi:hypothetical protein
MLELVKRKKRLTEAETKRLMLQMVSKRMGFLTNGGNVDFFAECSLTAFGTCMEAK